MPPRRQRRPHIARAATPLEAPPSSGAGTAAGGFVSPWVELRSATAHPFIYQRMIRRADRGARPGDAVNIYDQYGALFGRGLYNPRSQIAVRVLTHDDTPLDESFWRARLQQAITLRQRLRIADSSDAYRLVHAEGDGLSGLVVERYANCLAFEVFSLGMFQRWTMIARLLGELLGPPASLDRPDRAAAGWATIVRADQRVESLEGFRVEPPRDATPTGPVIREHGVRYRVDVAAGHKTGFFCDQRDNRLRFARLCERANVLDLCCYTGGFSLCARLLGGARSVSAVDLDEEALAVARENANLNQTRIDFVHADAFAYARQMVANGRQYQSVVLDPPKLALTRAELDDALHKYHDLNALVLQLVQPGGVMLTCSCSGLVSRDVFVRTVYSASRRAARRIQILDQSGAAPDHPVLPECPESAYLKALWLRVL